MKKSGSMLLCLVLFAGVKLSAQITITEGDLQAYISIGNTLETNFDTTTTSLDIGTTGATSWDFSGLSSGFQSNYTSVNPAGTPFGSIFPAATACLSGITIVQGYAVNSWQYLAVNNALLFYGAAAQGNVSGFEITSVISFNPADKGVVVPLTLGTNWSQDFVETDSMAVSPFPPTITITNIHTENMVDAYGTMTLPGGATYPALRVKTDQTENIQTKDGSSYSRHITYLFLSNSGTQVSVEATDTTSPNSGVIPVGSVTYITVGTTDVREVNNTVPDNFNLEQNYPNPFNPTTQINYSLPSSEKVVLKVYDELGREAATLVNQEQSPGNYTVNFDASGLASGVYFYRLQAGSYVQMKKMILMR